MSRLIAGLMLPLFCAVALGQTRNEREATVGMRAVIEQVVLAGTKLVPSPTTSKSKVFVRVLKTWPHGDHLRYDLEWVGMEPGTYNLVASLQRQDGSTMDGLPAISVEVTSLLPMDTFEPSEPIPQQGARTDGYSSTQIVVGVLWGVGLLSILFVGRKRKPAPVAEVPKPTLADRLRPLVEEVAAGRADDARKAELERLLVGFWRARLELGDIKAVDAVIAIKQHDEAGVLLRQVEAWLHMPKPPASVDIAKLLQPYRSVTADSLIPEAG